MSDSLHSTSDCEKFGKKTGYGSSPEKRLAGKSSTAFPDIWDGTSPDPGEIVSLSTKPDEFSSPKSDPNSKPTGSLDFSLTKKGFGESTESSFWVGELGLPV